MRSKIVILLIALVGPWQASTAAGEPAVLAVVEGPTEVSLGTYRGHVGHASIRFNATIDTGATTFRLVHWVDADTSHAPKVLPLEGLIGLAQPTPQNWYAQGFMRLYAGKDQIGEQPVTSVRVSEDGARGVVVFDWQRAEGTWRVTFLALPMGKSLFCSVKHFPAGEPVDWRISLLNFPAGATRDGEREIATITRAVKQGNKAQLSLSEEWWVTYYDNVYDSGNGKSEGPSALVYLPEDVSACDVQVGVYGVTTVMHPKDNEVRMILWDSFFGMKNAEAVAHMRETAQSQLATLRGVKFLHRSVFSDEWHERQNEIDQLLDALGGPVKESKEAADLNTMIAERVKRLRQTPERAAPSDETELIQGLAEQQKLLWHLRWEELLKE